MTISKIIKNWKSFNIDNISDLKKLRGIINTRINELSHKKDKNLNVSLSTRKIYEIDISNELDIKKHIQILNSYYGEVKKLNSNNLSKKDKIRLILDSCSNIMNKDISSLYDNLQLDENKIYYVYCHMDPMKPIQIKSNANLIFGATLGITHFPFYVGKGSLNRWKETNRNDSYRKIKQLLDKNNKEIQCKIIFDKLTEKEALILESKLIDIFGLMSYGGFLTNLDEGYDAYNRKRLYYDDLKVVTGKNINRFDICLQQL